MLQISCKRSRRLSIMRGVKALLTIFFRRVCFGGSLSSIRLGMIWRIGVNSACTSGGSTPPFNLKTRKPHRLRKPSASSAMRSGVRISPQSSSALSPAPRLSTNRLSASSFGWSAA